MGMIEFNKDGKWVSFDQLDEDTRFNIELELLYEGAFESNGEWVVPLALENSSHRCFILVPLGPSCM